mgnify:CR=1 FL=1
MLSIGAAPNQCSSRASAATYGIPRTYRSLARMLDDSKPDLLDVITSPVTHNEYVRAAAARGIATICQKPFGANYADAADIVDAAERVDGQACCAGDQAEAERADGLPR